MTTKRRSRENLAVREFILRNVEKTPSSIIPIVAKEFGLSRAAISNYLRRLIEQGLLTGEGKTSARTYKLRPISATAAAIPITKGLAEHDIWRAHIEPSLKGVPKNIGDILYYGFTEMFNNVIDHSESLDAFISYEQTYRRIQLNVVDHGIGIFEKIKRDFYLDDPRTALLELSKGKLTSDEAHHSGQGVFFTSRMFNTFFILSGNLGYRRTREDDDDWLVETEDILKPMEGTMISMQIDTDAAWTLTDVFSKYENADLSFAKTHVPIMLGKYGGEQLVSRSQAKRILARFDQFEEVWLDFKGVEQIGQAFADEIYRVFRSTHPTIKMVTSNASESVQKIIGAVGRDSTAQASSNAHPAS